MLVAIPNDSNSLYFYFCGGINFSGFRLRTSTLERLRGLCWSRFWTIPSNLEWSGCRGFRERAFQKCQTMPPPAKRLYWWLLPVFTFSCGTPDQNSRPSPRRVKCL